MNKLFLFLFVITFLLSQSNFYLFAFIPLVAMLFVVPLTTPEKFGEKKK